MRRKTAVSWLLLACAASPVAARQLGPYDLDRARIMLRDVQRDLQRHYYDSTFHGLDLPVRFRLAAERMQAAQSNTQLFALIAQALAALDDSHTTFWPPERVAKIRYGWRPYMIGDSCYMVAVARGSDAERQGVRIGDRVLAIGGVRPNRRDFWKVEYLLTRLDPRTSVTLVLETPGSAPREVQVASQVIARRAVVDLTGSDGGLDIWDLIRQSENWDREHRDEFASVGDSTLVWRLPTFVADDERIDAGVARARRYRNLILDLRGNRGGYERALLRLISRTFPDDVQVGTLRRRRGVEPLRSSARPEPYEGRMVVLIDARSASAAELYAATVKRLLRGAVLGDRSSGAVMRSRVYPRQAGGDIAALHAVSVTDADIVLADSTRLEHRGLDPDEFILPTSEDVATGRDPALARALQRLGHDIDPMRAGRLLRTDWRGIELW